MENIIELLLHEKSSKERARIIEKFRDWQREANKENILKIYKNALLLLDNGNEKEIEISLRVLSHIYMIFPLHLLDYSGKETAVSTDETVDLVYKILEFMKHNNGNIRLSAAHALNHFRSYIPAFEYVELFYNLLSLCYSEDKNKIKTIKLCLDKIFSMHLEMAIEEFMPHEVKRMKIDIHGDVTKESRILAKEIEILANKMIKETEKYIPDILKLRSRYLFEKNLIPYVENIGMFQILYEYQRLRTLNEEDNVDEEVLIKYIVSRLNLFLHSNLEKIKKIEDKKNWEGIFLNLNKNELQLLNLDKIYSIIKGLNEMTEKVYPDKDFF